MNGCQFEQKSFTVPAGTNIAQQRWDLAFMTREEFMVAYEVSAREYDELARQ